MVGEMDKAKSSVQISMYIHLLALVGSAVWNLLVNIENLNVCQETIRRTDYMISAHTLDRLHPNSAAQFYYQAAVVYATHGQPDKAMERLSKFAHTVNYLLTGDNVNLHGDSYFNALDSWFSQLDLGGAPPRDKKLIVDNAVQSLSHPVFQIIDKEEQFQIIKNSIINGGTYHE